MPPLAVLAHAALGHRSRRAAHSSWHAPWHTIAHWCTVARRDTSWHTVACRGAPWHASCRAASQQCTRHAFQSTADLTPQWRTSMSNTHMAHKHVAHTHGTQSTPDTKIRHTRTALYHWTHIARAQFTHVHMQNSSCTRPLTLHSLSQDTHRQRSHRHRSHRHHTHITRITAVTVRLVGVLGPLWGRRTGGGSELGQNTYWGAILSS